MRLQSFVLTRLVLNVHLRLDLGRELALHKQIQVSLSDLNYLFDGI
jgi:hypothetical protein